jgi:hypothetical protein
MSKSIAVDTDDPDNQVIRLTMTFSVSSPIVVLPQLRVYLDTVAGAAELERVLLHRTDGKPLQVSARTVDLPAGVHVDVVPVREKETAPEGPEAVPGDVWLQTRVEADTSPGLYRGSLAVHTDHPDLPELELPTSVRVRPLIEARPDVVQLWVSPDEGRSRSALLRVQHNGSGTFSITGIEVGDPELIKVTRMDDGSSRLHNVRVDLVGAVEPADLDAASTIPVVIHTDDPEASTVRVAVRVARAPGSMPRRTGALHRPAARPRVLRIGPTPTPGGGS